MHFRKGSDAQVYLCACCICIALYVVLICLHRCVLYVYVYTFLYCSYMSAHVCVVFAFLHVSVLYLYVYTFLYWQCCMCISHNCMCICLCYPPDPISHVCSLTGKHICRKYFTDRSVQIFKIMFRRFLFSRICSSAQNHALLVLLLNLVGFFIFT